MMKKLLFLTLVLLAGKLNAQSALKFQQHYGGLGYEYGYSIVQTPDGGYAIAGTSSSAGSTDGWLVRTDSLGLLLWSKFYTLPQIDIIRSMVQLSDSGFAMAGYTNSAGAGGYDAWVLRTDKNGDTLWTRTYGTTNWDFFYGITATYDNGFLCAGGTYGLGNGDEDIYLVRLDSIGDTLWTRTIGGTRMDEARAVVETSDSLFALVANTYSLGDTLGDGWLLRLNTTGDTLWTRTQGIADTADFLYDLCDLAYLDRILVCGERKRTDADVYMASYGYAGNENYRISFNTPASTERYSGIAVRPDNAFGTIGYTSTLGWGNGDSWFFTDAGFILTTFGLQHGSDEMFDITGTRDTGFAACGVMTPNGNLLADLYLVKIGKDGFSTLVLGVFDAQAVASDVAVVLYPNPAAGSTQVQVTSRSPISEAPQVRVFDAAGREVTNQTATSWTSTSANSQIATLDLHTCAAGLYFYTVLLDGVSVGSGKLMVAGN